MRELPIVSLRSHREVIAAKDETIRVQRETIESLTSALKAFEAYLESLKPKPQTRGQISEVEKQPRRQINYAELDPNNQEALVEAALAELGPGKHPASQVVRRVEHIRRQGTIQREAAAQRAQQPGPPPPPEAIPEAIRTLIDETEAQAIAAAEAS